jgi:uncharacterized repeat protein (TIGR01451 family)
MSRITAVLLLLVALAAAASQAVGAPGTLHVLDQSPALGHAVVVQAPGGGSFTATPGRALVRITPLGGASAVTAGWCVDNSRRIDPGVDYPVDLQGAADTPSLATPSMQELAWLISRADGLIAGAADPGLEAAAVQVAVWQLAGQAADRWWVTPDAALNARVAQLRDLARGRTPVTSLALGAPASVAGTSATLTVSGTPGADVELAASGAGAALSAGRVTLDASGQAQVAVTAAGSGTVTVTARAEGGALGRAAHLRGADGPQDMAFVTPVPLTASATLTFAAPAVAPAVGAPAAVARPAARRAKLRLVKAAPAQVVRGRAISYRLTVTNVSRHAATRVVVRDALPAGTYLRDAPPKAARLRGGALVWRIGTLAPGRSVTLRLRLSTEPARRAPVVNVGVASAANAATVRARARTTLRAPAVRPARVPVVAPARVAPVTG